MPGLDQHVSPTGTTHLARVVSVQDPTALGRVKVQLLTVDGDGEAEIWARVAVPFAGADRGAWFIPDVDDEVLITFLGGDARFPIVLGGLWNGAAAPPESVSGDRIDRWSLTGKAGTRFALVEDDSGPKVEFSTPAGVKGTLTDAGGGSIRLEDTAGNSITLDSQGITIQASAKVSVSAAQVKVSAGMVSVDAGMSNFSGVVKCDTLITNAVISSSYTPGAGNIW